MAEVDFDKAMDLNGKYGHIHLVPLETITHAEKDVTSCEHDLEKDAPLSPPSTRPSYMPPTTGDRVVYLKIGDAPKYGVLVGTVYPQDEVHMGRVVSDPPMAEVKFYNPMTLDGKYGDIHLVP